MKQVDKKHYNFDSYSNSSRWVSYYHQINETLKLKTTSILEIGVGDSVFGNYIKNNTNIIYKSIDIDKDLNADFVGNVTELPFKDNEFDTICAFEILEHIPFEKFEKALSEINRVSKNSVIISLPHFGPPIKFCIKIPFFKEIKVAFKVPILIKHKFNGEHYWEIGKKGYSIRKIKKYFKKYFLIQNDFIPFENQYHHFFILKNNE